MSSADQPQTTTEMPPWGIAVMAATGGQIEIREELHAVREELIRRGLIEKVTVYRLTEAGDAWTEKHYGCTRSVSDEE